MRQRNKRTGGFSWYSVSLGNYSAILSRAMYECAMKTQNHKLSNKIKRLLCEVFGWQAVGQARTACLMRKQQIKYKIPLQQHRITAWSELVSLSLDLIIFRNYPVNSVPRSVRERYSIEIIACACGWFMRSTPTAFDIIHLYIFYLFLILFRTLSTDENNYVRFKWYGK